VTATQHKFLALLLLQLLWLLLWLLQSSGAAIRSFRHQLLCKTSFSSLPPLASNGWACYVN